MPYREVSSRANEVEEIPIMLQVLCSLPKRPLSFWFNQHLHGFTTNPTRLWAGCLEDGAKKKRRGAKSEDRGGQKARTGLLLAPGVSGGATRITLSPRAAQLVLHKRVVGRGRASQCDEHKRKLSTAHMPSTWRQPTYLGKTKHYNGQHGESIRLKKEQALRVKAQKEANSG